MKKYIYLILSLLVFTQFAIAKDDCKQHIDNYYNNKYLSENAASRAAELAIQRRCLHNTKNPIYSDISEYNKKLEYFYGVNGNYSVSKKLIDYSEEAEVYSAKENIEKASEYVDKFNEILIEHYDSVLAAVILKEQVENKQISKAHQEELFKKIDGQLPKLEKCNPGICEGWGLVSLVAKAFPKCKENSCQKNITYEELHFALAKETNNLPKATKTITKLLTKDFGTPKSNGEVKAPLMMALYYTDYKKFLEESKKFLDKAQKTIKYDYQDAILLPLITQLMIENGNAIDLLPYTQTEYNNIAGLETSLALLSIRIGNGRRQELRAGLESYYELTSACEEYRYEEYNGEKLLRAGTPAMLTQNAELDFFLRQRIQAAYWVNDFGGIMESKATDYWCSPSLNPEGINTVFASAQIAKQFIKEAFIDDMILLPLFAFNKIKAVVEGMRKTPHLKISYYNGERVSEVAQNAKRVEMRLYRRLDEMEEDIGIAVGQDFMPDYVGDRRVNSITNSRTWTHDHVNPKKSPEYYENLREEREMRLDNAWKEDIEYYEGYYPNEYKKWPLRAQKRYEREIKYFIDNANDWMRNIGYDNTKNIARAMGVKWQDLKNVIKDNQIKYILQNANLDITRSIIERIKRLYSKHYLRIINNPESKFTIAYFPKGGRYNWVFDSNDIFLVEAVGKKDFEINEILKVSKRSRSLSKRNLFSPKNPSQTFETYVNLLECTQATPCKVFLVDGGKYFKMLSADGKKFIRITPHEYNLKEEVYTLLSERRYNEVKAKDFPKYHFHYYELYGDRAINYHINLDMRDPFNNLLKKSPEEIKELLIPAQHLTTHPNLIKVNYMYN